LRAKSQSVATGRRGNAVQSQRRESPEE
jgi:hypothetical protein